MTEVAGRNCHETVQKGGKYLNLTSMGGSAVRTAETIVERGIIQKFFAHNF